MTPPRDSAQSTPNDAGREATAGEDYFVGIDHSKPHWCKHDGGPALVQPPEWTVLYYLGAAASTPELETRDCPYAAAPRVVDAVESL